jgi:hypothetical protein
MARGPQGPPSQAKIDFGDLGTPSHVGSLAFNPKIKLKAWSGWLYWSPSTPNREQLYIPIQLYQIDMSSTMTTTDLLNAWDAKIAEMTQVRQALAAHLGLSAPSTASGRKGKKSLATASAVAAEVPKKGRGKKDPTAPKALPNAFAAFMRDASELFPTDWEEYVAELPLNDKGSPNLQGAKMKFALLCKDSTHADEYVEYATKHNAMVATVKASNSAAASEASSVTSAKSAKSAKSAATSASAPITKKAQAALEVAARKKEREEKKQAEEQAKADRKAEREAKAAAKLVAAAKKTVATKTPAAKKPAAKASKAIVIADEDEPVLMRGGYKAIGSSDSSSDSRAVTSSSNSSSSAAYSSYPPEEIDESRDDEEAEEDDGEDVSLTPFLFGEQRMIRTDEGETWLLNEDGSRGEWAGMYNAETEELDETAENPFEE